MQARFWRPVSAFKFPHLSNGRDQEMVRTFGRSLIARYWPPMPED
jgi:hypothetical protein